MISADAGPIARPATSPSTRPRRWPPSTGGARCCATTGPPGSVNNHWAEVTSIFSQGRAAMLFDDITFVTTFADATKSTVVGKVGYAPAPTGPHSADWRSDPPAAPNVTGLAMSGLGKKKEAAWLLVQYLSDTDDLETLHAAGRPGRAAVGLDRPRCGEGARPRNSSRPAAGPPRLTRRAPRPLSIANVSKARDFIGEVVVTAIQGGNTKAALATGGGELRRAAERRAREEVVTAGAFSREQGRAGRPGGFARPGSAARRRARPERGGPVPAAGGPVGRRAHALPADLHPGAQHPQL